jgi:ribosome-binding factor A
MSRKPKKRSNILPELAEPERAVPRRLRVEGQLMAELLAGLRRLEDPRLSRLHVTRVQMTDDLQLAKVYVHATGDVEHEQAERAIMRGLRSASGRLRSRIGKGLQLRYTPQLRFHYDHGVDNSRRVEELLYEIAHEGQDDEALPTAATDRDSD